MPTEIQYGVEAGGREWALSRGGKHSNNAMKRRRRWRAKERGGGCPDLRREMASNGFPGSLLSFHSSSSLHVSRSALALVVPFFLLFLCFSSLMLCSLVWCWDWDVQPAWPCCWDEAGVRTRPSVCERVCEGVCVGVCFLKETTLCPPVIISHSLFPLSPAHLRGFRGSKSQSRAQLLKVLSLGLKKSKKITLCINAKRKTWLAQSSSTSTVWHVLCMAAGSLRSESFTSTKCGGWLKVRGILAEGIWGVEREEGRWGVGRGEEDSEKTVVDSNSNSVCEERKGIQPMNSAGRQIQSMEVEIFTGKILRNDYYVSQILNWQ